MHRSYTEDDLKSFLDYTVEKGLINSHTANARKIATQKILSALDEDEKQDLRTVDREGVFQRFVNKMGKGFSPGSLSAYKSRFNKALDDFFRWAENPATFKPGLITRSVRTAKESGEEATESRRIIFRSRRSNPPSNAQAPQINPVVFPIPLRPGVVVQIHHLPLDLTAEEAKRVGAVVAALAVSKERSSEDGKK